MGRMSDLAIEMEENVGHALMSGYDTEEEVVNYLKNRCNMLYIDRRWVKDELVRLKGEF
jgi:hypothetical protein